MRPLEERVPPRDARRRRSAGGGLARNRVARIGLEHLEERTLLATGLVAAYDFSEAAGVTVLDASGNGNTGTLTGAVRTTAGKYGSALNFNGTNAKVVVANSSSLSLTAAMTLEAWVRPTALGDWSTAVMKERPGGLAYALYASDGTSRPPAGYINRGGSDISAVGASALTLNTWIHLATTYDGATLSLYVNGALVRSPAQTGSITTSTSPLDIGGNSVWGEYFSGLIDEVRVYNRALSLAEVQTDMNTPISSTPDTTPPSVSLTAPADNATVAATVTLTATASDNLGVAGVQFLLNGSPLGAEDTAAPYSLNWNTTSSPNATYTIAARARDAAGNLTTSTVRTVTVNNVLDTTAPTVTVTAPANNATVTGTTTITASASDNVGVVAVQFKLDGADLGAADTIAPYAVSWNTTGVADGTHTLTAAARDLAGNVNTAAVVQVTVANTDSVPPTVSLTAPAGGATVSGTVTVTAAASDDVGVAGVQFLLDGNSLGAEDTTAPYSVSWNTSAAANGSHTLSARVRDAADHSTTSAAVPVTVSNFGGVPLTINGAQRFQTVDGFGANVNAHSWNNGELKPALDMLNDQMGATIYRVVYDMEDWEATNDNADPNTPDWADYNAIYSNASFQELWGTLHYLNQKGVTTGITLSFMGRVPPWMGGSVINTGFEDEWVEMISTLVSYAINTEHVQFGQLDPLNEPDDFGIEGPQVDAVQYTRLLHKLAVKLDALGLGDLRFLGPNTASISVGVDVYMPAMMADPVVMSKVDHFAFHSYSGDTGGADAAIKRSAYPSKNFWMTEVTNPWDIMTQIGGNPSGSMIWDGYDSAYIHPTLRGESLVPPNDAGNGPSPIAYNTATGVYTPRQSFYQDEQIFKYVLPGSVRIGATESNGNLTVYAFYHQASGRVTIVGRNEGTSGITVAGSLSNLPGVTSFQFSMTDSVNNVLHLADVAVSNGSFAFSAPGNSFFTLTTLAAADTTPPSATISGPADGATVGGIVSVYAVASDNVGVAGLQFLLNGNNLGPEDTTSPYAVSWDTTTATNGVYTLAARVRDAAGNATVSPALTVTVNNNGTPPAVSVTAPSAGTSLSGTVTISATASDDLGVAGVRFLLDGVNLGAEDTTAPYSFVWNTTAAMNGSHNLTAVARDAAGNTTVSAAVTVTVSNMAPTGLVGAWGFEEGTGTTTTDVSGHALNGTLANATWTAAGKFGNALSFNGTNAWVTVADNSLLHLTTGMTLEAWIRPAAVSTDWATAILKERSDGLAYSLYVADGANRPPAGYINRNGTDVAAAGTSVLSLNVWTHLAVTYDGTTIRLYVNGTQAGSRAQTGSITSSTSPLRFGGNAAWGEYFNGLIDEVRIYSRALTSADIQGDMNNPVGGGAGALAAAGGPGTGPTAGRVRGRVDQPLSQTWLPTASMPPLVDEAISRWAKLRASPDQQSTLRGVPVMVADLAGTQLGFASGGRIWIDRDAAGYGWFIDPTPADDSEFRPDGAAAGMIDLLTVLVHEMGHLLGFGHSDSDGDVMHEAVLPGVRWSDHEPQEGQGPGPVGPGVVEGHPLTDQAGLSWRNRFSTRLRRGQLDLTGTESLEGGPVPIEVRAADRQTTPAKPGPSRGLDVLSERPRSPAPHGPRPWPIRRSFVPL